MPQPLTYERLFRIRHYECDANGHLNHSNYLRFMQETAFDASAAAGYDMTRYEELGSWWWIRDTEITYHKPIHYDQRVRLYSWVIDFQRTRSRRAYTFVDARSGQLLAEGITDWVYLNRHTLQPQRIPSEMVASFFPEGPPDHIPARQPFPPVPAPPPDVFTYTRRVHWHDLDMMQHVNNAMYLTYLEESSFAVGEAYGWTQQRMREDGFAIVARRYRIEYRQPAGMGDELAIATWVSDVRHASARRHYQISRRGDDTMIARASGLWAWVDIQSGRPVRISATFAHEFADNIV